MWNRLFDPEKPLWRALAAFADLLWLSILWVLCSLPIVTMGTATAALYDATVLCVRQRQPGTTRRFFTVFRRELRVGILTTLLWWAFNLLLMAVMHFFSTAAAEGLPGGALLATAVQMLLSIPLCAFLWLFPLLSRFTFGPLQLSKTAFLLLFHHLPHTMLVMFISLLAFTLCWNIPLLLLLVPGLTAYFWSFLMERVFWQYTPHEEPQPSDAGEEPPA